MTVTGISYRDWRKAGLPVSNGEGYVADRLNQFEGQFAPYGMARCRYKGMRIHETSMSMDEFNAAYVKWEEERLGASEQ